MNTKTTQTASAATPTGGDGAVPDGLVRVSVERSMLVQQIDTYEIDVTPERAAELLDGDMSSLKLGEFDDELIVDGVLTDSRLRDIDLHELTLDLTATVDGERVTMTHYVA